MQTDIVERLRSDSDSERQRFREARATLSPVLQDAADEIERLRAALRDCMQEAASHHRENESRAKIGGSDMARRKAKAIVARSGVILHNIRAIARAALEEK